MRKFTYYCIALQGWVTLEADKIEISDYGVLRFLRLFTVDGLTEPKLRIVHAEPPSGWSHLRAL